MLAVRMGGIKMASVNNYMNTGLISQNYDVINNVTKKYGENKISSGTMRKNVWWGSKGSTPQTTESDQDIKCWQKWSYR